MGVGLSLLWGKNFQDEIVNTKIFARTKQENLPQNVAGFNIEKVGI